MNKLRVNITISQEVHEKAKFFSIKEGKSLSENIEEMLTQYNKTRIKGVVSEPISIYNNLTQLQNSILDICMQLPAEHQSELAQFAEFLLSKNTIPQKRISLHGLFKGQLHMSDDFDEPLEMFKEYMP